MFKEILDDARQHMQRALESLRNQFARVRTGRANPALLEGIRVEYYGVLTPITQVASVSTADAHLIVIKPWDKSLLQPIEKAIVQSDLGLNPGSDGEVLRVPIPPLSQERREQLVKQVRKLAEDARVAVRGARREANELVKELEGVSEDDVQRALKEIQKLTDQFIAKVDEALRAKEAEILEQ